LRQNRGSAARKKFALEANDFLLGLMLGYINNLVSLFQSRIRGLKSGDGGIAVPFILNKRHLDE
jgi:hypothetical protein